MKRLAIIGAGPKAAAICAKAHCLRLAGRAIAGVRAKPARAAWSGTFSLRTFRRSL